MIMQSAERATVTHLHTRPAIGLISETLTRDGEMLFGIAANPVEQVIRMGAVPMIMPSVKDPRGTLALLDLVDGLLIAGGQTNIHPSLYGKDAQADDGPFDELRDMTALNIIPAAIERGIPMLLTCRGCQELNVALGGTLRREPQDLPEDQKHGTPKSAKTEDDRFKLRHVLNISQGGLLASIVQAERPLVNSLHSFLIDGLASAARVEATAEDGTIEAISVRNAKEFLLGVIFHPEYWGDRDETSAAILHAFASAVRSYAAERSSGRNIKGVPI
jgi:putative glutamine amidotransferase